MSNERRPSRSSDPGLALDLSRRKKGVPARVVRDSIVGARRAAAPYVTMARVAFARVVASRLARTGAGVLTVFALVAIFADALASDLPLVCRWQGTFYGLPNVFHPAALRGLDCEEMRDHAGLGDWLVQPLVAHGPARQRGASDVLLPPLTRGHPLGTDARGRDLFARVVHGTRTALGLGLAGALALVAIGVGAGAIAGFFGGRLDGLIARAVEALTSIPTLLLVIVVGALVPPPTTSTLLWTIALTRWPELARVVRAEVLGVLGKDYVTAARALGAPPVRVLLRHVLPNAIAPAIVAAAFGVASIILVESAVDFLNVGAPDTLASWGETLGEARTHSGAWWLVVFPGAALLSTLVALNLIGEAARHALDVYGSSGTA